MVPTVAEYRTAESGPLSEVRVPIDPFAAFRGHPEDLAIFPETSFSPSTRPFAWPRIEKLLGGRLSAEELRSWIGLGELDIYSSRKISRNKAGAWVLRENSLSSQLEVSLQRTHGVRLRFCNAPLADHETWACPNSGDFIFTSCTYFLPFTPDEDLLESTLPFGIKSFDTPNVVIARVGLTPLVAHYDATGNYIQLVWNIDDLFIRALFAAETHRLLRLTANTLLPS